MWQRVGRRIWHGWTRVRANDAKLFNYHCQMTIEKRITIGAKMRLKSNYKMIKITPEDAQNQRRSRPTSRQPNENEQKSYQDYCMERQLFADFTHVYICSVANHLDPTIAVCYSVFIMLVNVCSLHSLSA